MKLILATPGLSSKERRTVQYHLERFLPQLKRRLGRHHTGTLILRSRLTKDGGSELPLYHLTLSIRIPDHSIIVQKDGSDISELALDAEKAMKRELPRSIAKVRKETLRRRRADQKEAFKLFAADVAPKAAKLNGHAKTPDSSPVFARLRPILASLYAHAREQIRVAEVAGEIREGYLQPDDLVDQAIVQVIDGGAESLLDPEALEFRLFNQMHEILEAESARYCPPDLRKISLEDFAPEDERWGIDGTEREEREYYQPFSALLMEDVLADEHAHDPEVTMSDMEQHRLILKMLSGFHSKARSAFFLNRVEGFEIYEIAMMQNRDGEKVQADIQACIESLRESLAGRREKERPVAGVG